MICALLPTDKRIKPNCINKVRYTKLLDQFEIVAANLTNYHKRTDHEGMVITVTKPCLNEQVKHKNISLIWQWASDDASK